MFSFDDTEEKVTVRFVDGKGQDAIYEVSTSIQITSYPQTKAKGFCVAHPV